MTNYKVFMFRNPNFSVQSALVRFLNDLYNINIRIIIIIFIILPNVFLLTIIDQTYI